MKRRLGFGASLGLCAGLLLWTSAALDAAEKKEKDKDKKPASAAAEPAKKDEKGEDKPFDEVVKELEVVKGLFTFYSKAEEGKLLLEILPDQLDKTFLFAPSVDRAVGERGLYAAMMGDEFPFMFHRVGKSVRLIKRNTAFSAEKGTPAARATARSFPDAILASAKLASKPHPERKSLLVDAAELLVRDLPAIALSLSEAYQQTSYQFDKDKSTITGVRSFPENVLLELLLHYTTDNPKATSLTLPDMRSVPVTVKYELSTLPESPGFKPRKADDRVGHFLTIQQDFTSDRPSSPYVRRITRWHLEKADPKAPLSPPKQPIVFWLENTIPTEYRESITEGALLWNTAFERVGFKDAVVVKQQPDDADWDPADTRYSTIRWFAGVDASFAIGPSRANPFTGQIYDADIGISEGIIRSLRRFGEEFASPLLLEAEDVMGAPAGRDPRRACSYADGLVQQAAFAVSVLETRGSLDPETERRLMREYVVQLVAHEVGHTLGLRHNFRASTLLKVDELTDVKKTSAVSQSSSVMDYNPVIVAPKGETQGHFVPTVLGPYDHWAIEYAYKVVEGDEDAELNRVASRGSADPTLPYSTDEDALGTFSPVSIDPHANQYDQADDPLAYFRKRLTVIHELWGSMENSLARPGEGYQILRRALTRSLIDYNRAVLTSSKFVGGIHHRRDHVGDPGARSPYVPVAPAKQREALDFLATHAFGPKAFDLPASLHNKLAVERLRGLDWSAEFVRMQRIDFPWHDTVLQIQRRVIERLYHPITLARIQDNELRFASGEKPFRMAELFGSVEKAIWSELDAGAVDIPSLRRNVQREHLRQLFRLTLRQAPPPPSSPPAGRVTPPPPHPLPEDATTLARASLVRLQGKARRALASGIVTDATTSAHLQETAARIAAVLEAHVERRIE